MRAAEWISITFYVLLIAACVFAPLAGRTRLRVFVIGLAGLLVAWLLRFLEVLPGGSLARARSARLRTAVRTDAPAWDQEKAA